MPAVDVSLGTGRAYHPLIGGTRNVAPAFIEYPNTIIGVANSPTVFILEPTQLSTGTGVANNAKASISASPPLITGTGNANDVQQRTLNPVPLIAATGSSLNVNAQGSRPFSSPITGTGTANDTSVRTLNTVGLATGSGSAFGSTVSFTVKLASGTGSSNTPGTSALENVGIATGTGSAWHPIPKPSSGGLALGYNEPKPGGIGAAYPITYIPGVSYLANAILAFGIGVVPTMPAPSVASSWWNYSYPLRRNIKIDAGVNLVANHPIYVIYQYDDIVTLLKARSDFEDIEVIWEDINAIPPLLYRVSRNITYDIPNKRIIIIFNTIFPITGVDNSYFIYMSNPTLDNQGVRPTYVSSLYVTTATPQNGGIMFSRITEDWLDGESNVVNARAAISFTGLNARLTVETGPNRGIIELRVDNNDPTYVDTYNASVGEAVIFEALNLTPDKHYVRMRVTGNKSPNATDFSIKLTRVEYSLYVEAIDLGEEIFSQTGAKTYMIGA